MATQAQTQEKNDSNRLETVVLVMASSTVIELLMELLSNWIENLLGAAAGPMGLAISVLIVLIAVGYLIKRHRGNSS